MLSPRQKCSQDRPRSLGGSHSRKRDLVALGAYAAVTVGAIGLLGAAPSVADDGKAQLQGPLEALPDGARAELEQLLYKAGLRQVSARSVERSPQRQVAVMLALAEKDPEHAKQMYCDAGDVVLDSYDKQRSREENAEAMLRTLLLQLPRAREIGCLNHIENDEVVSVDIRVSDVPAEQHQALVQVAEDAVKQKRILRFLAPPREPDAFHFEFSKTVAAGDVGTRDKAPQP